MFTAEQARKSAIDAFVADLNRNRRAGFENESNTILKRAALGTDQKELSSEQFIQLIRDAQEGDKAARKRLQKVATGIQGTDENTGNTVNNLLDAGGQLLNLIDSISDSATKTSKAVATQLLYNQILERTSRQIDALGAGLDVLSKNLEGAVSQFAQFGEGIRQEIEQILSIQQSVAGTARGNVFERTGVSSRAEIEAGVQRVRLATGQGNAAFGARS